MSVLAVVTVNRKLWQGFSERSLPTGAWDADGGVTGDASGGNRQLDVVFAPLGVATGLAWSIERLTVQDLRDATTTGQLFSAGFDLLQNVSFNLQQSAGGSYSAIPMQDLSMLPIFLGVPAGLPSGAATVSIQMDNSNGNLANVRLEGYMWDQRTVSTPGGYQRPRGSPWGS